MDFLPIRVAGKSNKKIWFTFFDDNGHCIVVPLPHIPGTSLESTWKDDFSPNLCVILLGFFLKMIFNIFVVFNL